MAVTKTHQIKDTPSHDSRLSKYPRKKPNENTGSVPATLLTLDLTQTAALVSPIGKGVAFLTSDGNEEMSQGTLTKVDLTSDHGAFSNGVTGSKDGLNRSSNKLPEVELTGDPKTVSNKGATRPSTVSPLGKLVTYLTSGNAKKVW